MHERREALQRGWPLSSTKLTRLSAAETGKRFWGTTRSHHTCSRVDLASRASYLATKHHLQGRLVSRACTPWASLWLGMSWEQPSFPKGTPDLVPPQPMPARKTHLLRHRRRHPDGSSLECRPPNSSRLCQCPPHPASREKHILSDSI